MMSLAPEILGSKASKQNETRSTNFGNTTQVSVLTAWNTSGSLQWQPGMVCVLLLCAHTVRPHWRQWHTLEFMLGQSLE